MEENVFGILRAVYKGGDIKAKDKNGWNAFHLINFRWKTRTEFVFEEGKNIFKDIYYYLTDQNTNILYLAIWGNNKKAILSLMSLGYFPFLGEMPISFDGELKQEMEKYKERWKRVLSSENILEALKKEGLNTEVARMGLGIYFAYTCDEKLMQVLR